MDDYHQVAGSSPVNPTKSPMTIGMVINNLKRFNYGKDC